MIEFSQNWNCTKRCQSIKSVEEIMETYAAMDLYKKEVPDATGSPSRDIQLQDRRARSHPPVPGPPSLVEETAKYKHSDVYIK